MNEQIIRILNTLNTIDVHGKQNLDKLLGCIQALEALLAPEQQEVDNG